MWRKYSKKIIIYLLCYCLSFTNSLTYAKYSANLGKNISLESIKAEDILDNFSISKNNPEYFCFSTRDRLGSDYKVEFLIEGDIKSFVNVQNELKIEKNTQYKIPLIIDKNKRDELLKKNNNISGKIIISFKKNYIKKEIDIIYSDNNILNTNK